MRESRHDIWAKMSDARISPKIDEAIFALNAVGPVLLIIENLENVQNEDQMISDHAMLHLLQTLRTNLREGRVLITGRSMRNELLVQETFPQCAQRDATSCG